MWGFNKASARLLKVGKDLEWRCKVNVPMRSVGFHGWQVCTPTLNCEGTLLVVYGFTTL